MKNMKGLVIYGAGDMRYKEVPIPSLKEDEVLIRVKACGICGSDLPRALYGKAHYYPIILGHEFSGEVVATGEKVNNFKEGDRVVAAPLLPCGQCPACKMGKPAMCSFYGFLGSRQNGAMAEFIAVKEENLIKLPDEISFYEGALIEPLTVAIHGVERFPTTPGDDVVIFGAGTIGLLVLQVLKARGLGRVFVIDVVQEKLDLARKLGADITLNANEIDVVKYFNDNGRPKIAIETAGSSITQRQCLEVVDTLGKVVYIGTCTDKVEFPPKVFERILRGELIITGSWMSYSVPFPGFEWYAAIRYISEKKVKVEPLISHIFTLEEGDKAFKTLQDPNCKAIKVMFAI